MTKTERERLIDELERDPFWMLCLVCKKEIPRPPGETRLFRKCLGCASDEMKREPMSKIKTIRYRHGVIVDKGLDLKSALTHLIELALSKKDFLSQDFTLIIKKQDILVDTRPAKCLAMNITIDEFEAKHESESKGTNGSVVTEDPSLGNKEVESKG